MKVALLTLSSAFGSIDFSQRTTSLLADVGFFDFFFFALAGGGSDFGGVAPAF
jgi:hypothetical protein